MSGYQFDFSNKKVIDAIEYTAKDVNKRLKIVPRSEKQYNGYKYFKVGLTGSDRKKGSPSFGIINVPSGWKVPKDEWKDTGNHKIKFNKSTITYDKSCGRDICPGEYLQKLSDMIVEKITTDKKISKGNQFNVNTFVQSSMTDENGETKQFDDPLIWVICRKSRGSEWDAKRGIKAGDLKFSVFDLSKPVDNEFYELLAKKYPNKNARDYQYAGFQRIFNKSGGLTPEELADMYKPGTKVICTVVVSVAINYKDKKCLIQLEVLSSKNMIVDLASADTGNTVGGSELAEIAQRNRHNRLDNNIADNQPVDNGPVEKLTNNGPVEKSTNNGPVETEEIKPSEGFTAEEFAGDANN